MKKDLDNLIRMVLSVALDSPFEQRKRLFELLPQKGLFIGPYYTLGKLLREDATINTMDVQAVSRAAGIDPIELAGLYGLNETFRPLREHLIRLLAVRLTVAQTTGEDVIQWAEAISKVSEAGGSIPSVTTESEPLFVSASYMLAQVIKINPLLGKVIERGCTGQIFGPSGGGKTFVALDMSCAVATGGKWNGNRCAQGIVLYFAGEGLSGLRRRARAWYQHNNNANLSGVHISRTTITLDASGIRAVIVEGRQLEMSTGEKVSLIVIDTLARHIIGDENSTQNMSEFVQSVDSLRDAFPGASAIIIHHTGNAQDTTNRSRGSSALKAACDFEIQCDKGLLTFTKVKDGELPEPVEFRLVPVQIGLDDDGEIITSCVVQYGERSAKHREVGLTSTERQLLELVNCHPNILAGDLRSVFYDKRRESEPEAKTNTLKNAFLRAYQGLTEKRIIYEIDNAVMLHDGTPSQRHKPSQSDYMTDESDRHNRHTPLKGCDVVTGNLTQVIPHYIESDFGEAA